MNNFAYFKILLICLTALIWSSSAFGDEIEVETSVRISCCLDSGCELLDEGLCYQRLNEEDVAKWKLQRSLSPEKVISKAIDTALPWKRREGIIVNARVESCDIPVKVAGVGYVAYCEVYFEGGEHPEYVLWPIYSTMPERVAFHFYHDPIEGREFEIRVSRFYHELGESVTGAILIERAGSE